MKLLLLTLTLVFITSCSTSNHYYNSKSNMRDKTRANKGNYELQQNEFVRIVGE